jgi:nickel transport protein
MPLPCRCPAVRAFPAALLAAILPLLLPSLVQAHAMLHEVTQGEAVVVRFSFPGADQPWFEPYEIFAPGADTPFQSGRVNALGEVSFRPDRAGDWQLRVVTADGHGTQLMVAVNAAGAIDAVAGAHGHAHDHWLRVLAALGYLLGFFGLWALWRARRAGPAAGSGPVAG